MSIKLKSQILSKLYTPITHIIEIPETLKGAYLIKDAQYQDTNLVCVMAVDRIWVIKIINSKLGSEKFW